MKKRICLLLSFCLLCATSLPVFAESKKDDEYDKNVFSPANAGISESEIAKQIQPYSKSEDKYSFTYKFKNYVEAKINFSTQKTSDISVKLVTTSSGGAKNIFYRIYQKKNLSSTYLKQLKFPTDKEASHLSIALSTLQDANIM